MTITQLSRWQNLTRLHRPPWYLDQNNASGVCVKDSTGEIVFYDDFGSIPEEMPRHMAETIRCRSVALALWLVAISESV
jgi:hypothetical protein